MAFNEDQTYDYDATAKAIYNAVVASTVPENLTADDVTINNQIQRRNRSD